MTTSREERRKAEAAEALRRAGEDGSLFDTTMNRATAHFRADDAPDDPLEIWGRRIGRALALLVVIGLLWTIVGQLQSWPKP